MANWLVRQQDNTSLALCMWCVCPKSGVLIILVVVICIIMARFLLPITIVVLLLLEIACRSSVWPGTRWTYTHHSRDPTRDTAWHKGKIARSSGQTNENATTMPYNKMFVRRDELWQLCDGRHPLIELFSHHISYMKKKMRPVASHRHQWGSASLLSWPLRPLFWWGLKVQWWWGHSSAQSRRQCLCCTLKKLSIRGAFLLHISNSHLLRVLSSPYTTVLVVCGHEWHTRYQCDISWQESGRSRVFKDGNVRK